MSSQPPPGQGNDPNYQYNHSNPQRQQPTTQQIPDPNAPTGAAPQPPGWYQQRQPMQYPSQMPYQGQSNLYQPYGTPVPISQPQTYGGYGYGQPVASPSHQQFGDAYQMPLQQHYPINYPINCQQPVHPTYGLPQEYVPQNVTHGQQPLSPNFVPQPQYGQFAQPQAPQPWGPPQQFGQYGQPGTITNYGQNQFPGPPPNYNAYTHHNQPVPPHSQQHQPVPQDQGSQPPTNMGTGSAQPQPPSAPHTHTTYPQQHQPVPQAPGSPISTNMDHGSAQPFVPSQQQPPASIATTGQTDNQHHGQAGQGQVTAPPPTGPASPAPPAARFSPPRNIMPAAAGPVAAGTGGGRAEPSEIGSGIGSPALTASPAQRQGAPQMQSQDARNQPGPGMGGFRGPGGNRVDNIQCRNCAGFGHIARNCPNPRAQNFGRGQAGDHQRGFHSQATGGQAQGDEQQQLKEWPLEIRQQFNFPSRELNSDTVAILDRVTEYAKSVAKEVEQIEEIDKIDLRVVSEIKNDHGLRTAFNSTDPPTPVVANYFPINILPTNLQIHVYNIEMIREIWANGRRIELKNRYCKEAVFKELQTSRPSFQSLNTQRGFWVTDFDTIWSVQPLFLGASGTLMLPRETQVQGRDRSYRPFTVAEVVVHERNVLDLSQHVSQLFRGALSVASDQDSPAILTSGLNAMLTEFARRSGRCVSTSAHKLYETQKDKFELDVDSKKHLASTIQALSGYVVSVRPSFDRLLLNVNTANSPFFHNLTVQEFADRLLANNNMMFKKKDQDPAARLSKNDRKNFEATMRGIRVRITDGVTGHYPTEDSRMRVVTEFGLPIGRQSMRDGSGQTVLERFTVAGNLQHILRTALGPDDFSVNVGKPRKKRDPRQSEEWLPARLLTIDGYQPIQGQLRSYQTDTMIKFARKMPSENANLITQDGIDMFGFHNENGRTELLNFGFEVDANLVKLNARRLKAPLLQYGNRIETTKLAAWNLSEHKFKMSKNIKSIRLLDLVDTSQTPRQLDGRSQHLDGFLEMLKGAIEAHFIEQASAPLDIKYHQQESITKQENGDFNDAEIENCLRQHLLPDEGVCNVIILPFKADYDLYASIKRVAELKLGLKSLCVTYSNIQATATKSRGPAHTVYRQLTSNLALKCNLKEKGDNHHLYDGFQKLFAPDPRTGDLKCDTIVIGADVAHPLKTAAPGCPSIASVVGSIDNNFVKFPGSMRLQRGRKETIDKLWDMVKERLIDWAHEHGRDLPKRILFYRDGVSESQYDQVIREEMTQIHKAYKLARAWLDSSMESCDESDVDVDDDDTFYSDQKEVEEDDDSKDSESIQDNTGPVRHEAESLAELQNLSLQGTAVDTTGMPTETADQDNPEGGRKELTKLEAWTAIKAGKVDFELTYVVVGKRHNTRFYAPDTYNTYQSKDQDTRQLVPNGNVFPGTVVDHTITNPYSFDFFLQSHQPIAGTGRSAHYYVLTNQMQLSAEELQNITHAFCYVYAKATRGVSYCAPAYYADRLCDRGRAYLRDWLLNREKETRLDQAGRDMTQFKGDVMRHIYNSDHWRPHRHQSKYGVRRRNPWHPTMDKIMFYL